MFKKSVSLLVAISVATLSTGCSMFVPQKQKFSVTASESDAKIYVNGEYVGQGHIQTRVKRNDDVSVLVKKEGFIPVTRSIGTDFSTTGILDVVFGYCFLVPLIGLFFPGCRSLEQTNLAVTMEREDIRTVSAVVPAQSVLVQ